MSKRPDRHRPPDAPGMVHVYTGDGKGKTTCAVGLATRAAGAGLRVWMLQFDKNFEDAERCNERAALEKLGVTLIATGCNRLLDNGRFRFKNLDSDLEEARRGLTLAREVIEKQAHDLIILDEAIASVATGLLREGDITDLIALHRAHPRAELVLTGRGAWPGLMESADLVTEMKMHRHYFEQGVTLRPGIDH